MQRKKVVTRLLQHVFQNSIKKHKPHEINYAILRSSTSSGKTLLKIPKLLLPLFSVDFWFLSDRLLFSLFFWDFNMLVTNILMQFLLWHLDLTWNKKFLHPPPPRPQMDFSYLQYSQCFGNGYWNHIWCNLMQK